MRDRAIEFIKKVSKNDGNSTVNYKPYQYGSLVESIPFSKAVNKFMEDLEEMKIYTKSFNLDENKAFEMTCNIWKKHIIVF